MVNTSTAWTLAEAAAGSTPRLTSKVLEITPNAMPSAPSTSCAAKPTRMKGRMSAKLKIEQSRLPRLAGRNVPLPAHKDAAGRCKCLVSAKVSGPAGVAVRKS